ncbi:hypothetical protein BGX26_005195 [Mortierella sp. AD094]|nr:hypothetical protein BGX26_005195 [Mortierella sp. AD094]
MTDRLTLFCLVNGESTSNAFSVKVSSADTVDDLKNLIKTKKTPEFDDIAADKITLWDVSIPVIDDSDDSAITLDSFNVKKKLLPTTRLRKLFPEGSEDDVINIIVQRPPRAKDLDSEITFKLIIKGEKSKTLYWETIVNTATLDDLRDRIHGAFSDLNNSRRNIAIEHPKCNVFPDGGISQPLTDVKLRSILKRYIQGGMSDLTVHLLFPSKGFSYFTMDDVSERLGVSKFGSFDEIERSPCMAKEHTEALNKLYASLELAIDSIEVSNEACTSRYVCPYMMAAVSLFPDLKLTPEREIKGRWGNGPVDYAIESKTDESYMLGVTEVKFADVEKAVPQNLMQLDATLTNAGAQGHWRKESTPMVSYGIITDAKEWHFIECTLEPADTFTIINEQPPIIRRSQLPVTVNYVSDRWKDDALTVFEYIVWLVGKMSPTTQSQKRPKKDNSGNIADIADLAGREL